MYDYHIHTTYSSDSKMSCDRACEQAFKLGLKEIAITDHLDYDCPNGIDYTFDYAAYLRDINANREKYQGGLNIIVGLELGLQPHVLEESRKFVRDHRFDFVIASVHNVGGCEVHNGDFCAGKTKNEAYQRYFTEVYNLIQQFTDFNVVGHMDLVRRYRGYSDRTLDIKDFSDILEAILQKLVDLGKGIEVNASGFRYDLADTLPTKAILKRYRELGGEVITVGSDAHRWYQVGDGIDQAYSALRDAGFEYITLFREMEPYYIRF